MSNFATVAELAAYLARDIDNADPSALLALSLASDTVRAYIGQEITSVEDDEITLDGTGTTLVLLPELPVTEISSVVEDGLDLTEDEDYYWSAQGEVIRVEPRWEGITRVERPYESLKRVERRWLKKPRAVVITYSHGYATVPGPVKAATLALAGRIIDSPSGVKQETIGAYSVTYSSGTPTLADNEARLLDQYRTR
jgi:hypothetical protein